MVTPSNTAFRCAGAVRRPGRRVAVRRTKSLSDHNAPAAAAAGCRRGVVKRRRQQLPAHRPRSPRARRTGMLAICVLLHVNHTSSFSALNTSVAVSTPIRSLFRRPARASPQRGSGQSAHRWARSCPVLIRTSSARLSGPRSPWMPIRAQSDVLSVRQASRARSAAARPARRPVVSCRAARRLQP